MLEIRGEYPVEAGEIQPRTRNEGHQAGDAVERFQYNVRRAVAKGVFVRVDNPPSIVYRETLGGNGRASDIAAQAFQATALMGFAHGGGVQ